MVIIMRERFTVDDGLENVLCWEINDKENEDMTCGECAKLLNDLHEENQELKRLVKVTVEDYTDLKQSFDLIDKENEQLKFQLNDCLNKKLFSRRKLEEENERLKSENQSWLKTASHFDNVAHNDRDYAKRTHKENKELKREVEKFKEWEKHIGDVKREDLDRVFNMSIYEITEAFEYYKERIKKLEKELEE